MRHLQFICYESCPLDAGLKTQMCLELSPVKIIFTRARWSVNDLVTSLMN